jgi:glutamate-1-semialdehyde 2,1-aminomutase
MGALTRSSHATEIAARARAVMPGGVNSGQRQIPALGDFVIASAHGSTFTDADGRQYDDYHTAFGPQLLGHADPDVDRAFGETARRVDLIGVGVTEIEVELAERLVELVPSFEQVLLTSTGSEATFHAIRLARAVTGRRHLIKFQGCFHGWHDSVAMNVISPPDKVGTKDPLSRGILPETLDATLVCRFNDLTDVTTAFDLHDGDVAAVILEPIPHNIGAVLPEPGFLEGLRRLCDEHGSLLIFDEVITGFRHGLGGYEAVASVQPDLATRGKAMANGYPIGALGGRAELMSRFSSRTGGDVFFAGTYNGHPGAAAAALAVIEKLQQEPVLDHIFRLGERARLGLREIVASIGMPAVVAGFGSVFCVYFLDGPVRSYDDLLRNDAELYVGYRLESIGKGIFELPLNLKRSHISYAHTDAQVDRLVAEAQLSIRAVLDRRARGATAGA